LAGTLDKEILVYVFSRYRFRHAPNVGWTALGNVSFTSSLQIKAQSTMPKSSDVSMLHDDVIHQPVNLPTLQPSLSMQRQRATTLLVLYVLFNAAFTTDLEHLTSSSISSTPSLR